MPDPIPFIPETITVHLGMPDSSARNVTVTFDEYLANVASGEIYPTWPDSALRANIYAQASFALNRVYTQYYRSRGYDFDITSSTAFDQSYADGREIFENIKQLTGELFNSYVRRQGSIEPLFTAYCNGTTVTCGGLSQWGTVTLANRGLTPYEILQSYYGNDIDIVSNVPIRSPDAQAPTLPLRLGLANDEVRRLQLRLNRISTNYPSIPKIVIPDGVFSFDTLAAVTEFQRVFGLEQDGVVGQATWYTVQRIYNAVKRLNELDSEGVTLEEVTSQYPGVLRYGDSGNGVLNLQYYLSYLAQYYATIPTVALDGIFGDATLASVIALQSNFELSPDGVVGPATWNTLYRAYLGIIESVPVRFTEGLTIPYGGVALRLGSESESVRVLQEYLNYIGQTYPQVEPVTVTGYFGNRTQAAVIAVQELLGLPATGSVSAVSWAAIADLYSDLYIGSRLGEGQYPGAPVGSGT